MLISTLMKHTVNKKPATFSLFFFILKYSRLGLFFWLHSIPYNLMKTDFDYSVMREIMENFGVLLEYEFNQFCGISLPNPCVKQSFLFV